MNSLLRNNSKEGVIQSIILWLEIMKKIKNTVPPIQKCKFWLGEVLRIEPRPGTRGHKTPGVFYAQLILIPEITMHCYRKRHL